MTGAEFTNLFVGNPALREYVLIQAKRHSKIREQQEDSVQEAWLIISTAPAGKCMEFYQELAYKAIYSAYWQTYKERLLFREHDQVMEAARHQTPERTMSDELRYKANRDWRD